MSDAPERIWADPDHWRDGPDAGILDHPPEIWRRRREEYTEYVRADIVPRWSTDMDAAPRDGSLVVLHIVGHNAPVIARWDQVRGWEFASSGIRIRRGPILAWYALPAPPKGET
jgi:hypothetical protein